MKFSQRLAISYIRAKFSVIAAVSKRKAALAAFDLFCTPLSRNKKKLPKIFEEAEQLQVEFEKNLLRGFRWNRGQGKKALILHGFESSAINFDRYIRPLIRKGYEVVAFDAPAHGKSQGKKITAPIYKRMIEYVHQTIGPFDSFFAHSFGGLALALALEELDHTPATKAVFVAPATETVTAISSFFQFLKLDPGIKPEFDKVIIQNGGVSAEWYSIKRAMKHIRAQILWIHDEDDQVTPLSDALNVKKEYPQIKFTFTKGLGHRRIYRDNKVTKEIIEFL